MAKYRAVFEIDTKTLEDACREGSPSVIGRHVLAIMRGGYPDEIIMDQVGIKLTDYERVGPPPSATLAYPYED